MAGSGGLGPGPLGLRAVAGGLAAPGRPAALVPFRCRVGIAVCPQVAGVLGGRASWCEIVLDGGWLLDVWGRGLAVVDGQLVVAAEPVEPAGSPGAGGGPRWSVLAVGWGSESARGPLTPRLVRRVIDAIEPTRLPAGPLWPGRRRVPSLL